MGKRESTVNVGGQTMRDHGRERGDCLGQERRAWQE